MQSWYAVIGQDIEVERLHLAALGERAIDRRTRQGRGGTGQADPSLARMLDQGSEAASLEAMSQQATPNTRAGGISEAVELLRQVEASDIQSETLERIEEAVDRLCRSYSSGPPDAVRGAARRLLRQIAVLLRRQLTLGQRRRLLVAAGWLSLLTSALQFDLGDRDAAEAMRQTAYQLGRHAGHHEIVAWAFETEAWFGVCDGRYREAVDLARAGQGFAGRATSATVQLAVQEARAWARRGDKAEVRGAMRRAGAALRRLPRPAHPEHHFVFDPSKLLFYTATCFVRVGDAERAEEYAREVIERSDGPPGVARWPRRLITARLDLGLALTQLDRPDEAGYVGEVALASDSVVASNLWQAGELDAAFMREYATLPEAQDFHERYLSARRMVLAVGQR